MKRFLAVASSIVLASSTLLTTAVPAGAYVGNVVITVRCSANPETLKITNNRSRSITITKVGSTYQQRAGEPYRVNKGLQPGTSVTYRFGTGSGANKLTNQFIFATNSSEKAKIMTNLGTVTKSC